MERRFAEIAFTDAVKARQTAWGSRETYEHMQAFGKPNDVLGPKEQAFLAARDSFYMATVNANGWPYVQHRGGPAGFLHVVGPRTIGFADFRGNAQFVSVGNAATDDRVALILVDYPHRQRLKLLGHMRVVDVEAADPKVVEQLVASDYGAHVERIVLIDVEALDWNCPQHITPRYTEAEFAARWE